MKTVKIKGREIPNYEPTEAGWLEWEKNYNTGDTLAFQAKFPDIIGMLIQVRGQKFPNNERFAHIESIIDGDDGLTMKADGVEVRRANVDDNRQAVFEKKKAMVIYRCLPEKDSEALNKYMVKYKEILYSDYDMDKIKGMFGTNFKNFWNFLTGKRDEPNVDGNPKLLVCCDCDYAINMATGLYNLLPGTNLENIDPSNLVQDPAYWPIAAIGL